MHKEIAFVVVALAFGLTSCGGPSRALPASSASARAAAARPRVHGAKYAVTDLGTLGGSYSSARAINAGGEVTGISSRADGSFHAFTYTVSRGMLDIGTLGGTTGVGNGINRSGDVAGYSTTADGTYHAFLYRNGAMQDIGDLGGGSATAYALNDAAIVVGSSVNAGGLNDPFMYKHGKMKDLGTLGGHASAEWNNAADINDSRQIVGISYDASGNFLGFLWSKGKMQNLGTLGGDWSEADAINAKGQVTGQAYTAGNAQAHAFLWSGGKIKDLGVLPGSSGYSWGFGINRAGVVVGRSEQTQGSTYVDHAFAWHSGKMRDLNDLISPNSPWLLNTAYAVSDSGAIVGEGTIGGETHAFLLTPR
jgi:probable HAF family extracellular repeat protein